MMLTYWLLGLAAVWTLVGVLLLPVVLGMMKVGRNPPGRRDFEDGIGSIDEECDRIERDQASAKIQSKITAMKKNW